MINPLSAVGALAEGAAAVAESRLGAPAPMAPSAAGPVHFSDVLAQVSSQAIDTVKSGEAAAITGIQGKASVQQVVEAIMSAEQTLQTAIAIRDKVVSAYQEISRMTI
jgi:flagellar hook-basal body complex protein FliE